LTEIPGDVFQAKFITVFLSVFNSGVSSVYVTVSNKYQNEYLVVLDMWEKKVLAFFCSFVFRYCLGVFPEWLNKPTVNPS
jgi:hypothetical protein